MGLGDEEVGPSNGEAGAPVDARPKESLLVTAVRARRGVPEESEAEKRLKEEREMLKQITTKQALKSVGELAKVDWTSCCLFLDQSHLPIAYVLIVCRVVG